jgi:hypothetical protein
MTLSERIVAVVAACPGITTIGICRQLRARKADVLLELEALRREQVLRLEKGSRGSKCWFIIPEPPTCSGTRSRGMTARPYVTWYGGERKQEWRTPRTLFDGLDAEYRFTLDGAGDQENGLLPRVSTLTAPISWAGERVFCNPPWSDIPPFVELGAVAEFAVLLVPARVNARWFHRALELGAVPTFFLGKPKFEQPGRNSPVDCLLLVYRGGCDG